MTGKNEKDVLLPVIMECLCYIPSKGKIVLRKIDTILNILMGLFFGVFIGNTIVNYREYRAFPEIYEMRSAPWYCYGALTSFILFMAVVVACVLIKIIIRVFVRKKDEE